MMRSEALPEEDEFRSLKDLIEIELKTLKLPIEFQSLENVVKAIGLPECELCTYCWNGKE